MRRVAYKTKQNFLLQRKILYLTKYPDSQILLATNNAKIILPNGNRRKTRSYSALRSKMLQGVAYLTQEANCLYVLSIEFTVQT